MPGRDPTTSLKKLQVLIVNLHPLLCEGIVSLLAGNAEIEVVGPMTLDQALQVIEQHPVDALILAGERTGQQQNTTFSELLDRIPHIPVIQARLSERTLRLYVVREVPASKANLLHTLHTLSSRLSFPDIPE